MVLLCQYPIYTNPTLYHRGEPITGQQMEMKNMAADYTMEDDKWQQGVSIVTNDLASREGLDGKVQSAIETFLMLGDTDSANRKKWWTNIRNVYSALPDNPLRTRSTKIRPDNVLKNADSVAATYQNAATALFASHPLFGELLMKRGGNTYANETEYGEAMGASTNGKMLGFYDNHVDQKENVIQWDGTLNKAGVPTLIHPQPAEVIEG